MAPETTQSHEILKKLDSSKITKLHWQIMFISGMGFFTDAYDLFIIGVVMAILKNEWHPTATETGLVTSTALIASAIGAILFGRIADMLGRKRIYGYECLILAGGAIASAFSPNILWLIIFRFILGIGIGGDYPVSATIMSEYAGICSRGMLITLVFTMQAAGLILGPLLASAFLASGMPHDVAWRMLLAVGAIPALAVFHMRRNIHETPRYLLAAGRRDEFERSAGSILGEETSREEKEREEKEATVRSVPFGEGFAGLVRNSRWRAHLAGASLAWFLMDFAYYGNTVSSPLVLQAIRPHQTLLQHTLIDLLIFTVAATPGYLFAAWKMDHFGRKAIQALGFLIMAATFALIALIPNIQHLLVPFLIIYGASYFFTEFGPNATTFVYPAEIFPVQYRTTGHGIASATGKIGAFIGVFLFPILLKWHGLFSAELAAAIVSALGVIVTLALLPETKGKSLEELTRPA